MRDLFLCGLIESEKQGKRFPREIGFNFNPCMDRTAISHYFYPISCCDI